jgi:hypothetical protein
MKKMMKTLSLLILCHLVLISGVCYGDETDLFSSSAAARRPDRPRSFGKHGLAPGDWGTRTRGTGITTIIFATGIRFMVRPRGATTYTAPTTVNSAPIRSLHRAVLMGSWADYGSGDSAYYTIDCGSRYDCSKRNIALKAISLSTKIRMGKLIKR